MGKKIGRAMLIGDVAVALAGWVTLLHATQMRQTNRQILGLGMLGAGLWGAEKSATYFKDQLGVK